MVHRVGVLTGDVENLTGIARARSATGTGTTPTRSGEAVRESVAFVIPLRRARSRRQHDHRTSTAHLRRATCVAGSVETPGMEPEILVRQSKKLAEQERFLMSITTKS